jgi:hypothetical protein
MMMMFFLGMLLMAAIDLLTLIVLRHRFRAALDQLIALKG